MLAREKWTPARNNPDSKAAPTDISKAYVLLPHADNGPKKGNCNECGRPGHWARDCPNKHRPSSNGNGTRPPFPKRQQKGRRDNNKKNNDRTSWKKVAPSGNESQTKTMIGKTWHWCAKCRRWSTTHNTEQHTSPAKPQANVVIDPAAWHARVTFEPTPPSQLKETLWSLESTILPPMFCVLLGLALPHVPHSWILPILMWTALAKSTYLLGRHHGSKLPSLDLLPAPTRQQRRTGPLFTKKRRRAFDKLLLASFPHTKHHGTRKYCPRKIHFRMKNDSRTRQQRQSSCKPMNLPPNTPPYSPDPRICLRQLEAQLQFRRSPMQEPFEAREKINKHHKNASKRPYQHAASYSPFAKWLEDFENLSNLKNTTNPPGPDPQNTSDCWVQRNDAADNEGKFNLEIEYAALEEMRIELERRTLENSHLGNLDMLDTTRWSEILPPKPHRCH